MYKVSISFRFATTTQLIVEVMLAEFLACLEISNRINIEAKYFIVRYNVAMRFIGANTTLLELLSRSSELVADLVGRKVLLVVIN